MKLIILIAVLLTFATLSTAQRKKSQKIKLFLTQGKDLSDNWLSFKTTYGRLYRNQSLDSRRLGIFKTNLEKINQHNLKFNDGSATYTLGITNFADWTEDEFMRYVNRGLLIRPRVRSPRNQTVRNKPVSRSDLPDSIDWRIQGFVNPVRDQGQCGSCWTFSSVSTLESHYYKANGELLSFSEQHLVDCVYLSQGQSGTNADGCQGGWMTEAFDYIIKNKGISSASSYPYSSADSGKWSGKCNSNGNNLSGEITDYVEVTSGTGDEEAVTAALANQGPVSAAVYVTKNFQHYTSGVFTDTTCPSGKLNHAIVLVGYGTQDGQDYYISRNSWGTSWGLDGYMLYRRNNNNQCGIASYVSYPNVKQINAPTPIVNPTTKQTSIKPTTLPVKTTTSSQTIQCPNGTGWYPSPGCQSAYYCTQNITTFKCPTGYSFDPSANNCKLNSIFKCPI